MSGPTLDPWAGLSAFTSARIGLGRSGAALPTRAVLALSLAHALARDAVHAPFDAAAVERQIGGLGHKTLRVGSAAPDRNAYLQRPDLGRRLSEASLRVLDAHQKTKPDVLFVIADGLSSAAVHAHAAPMIATLQPVMAEQGWMIGPVVLASQARVALGDEAAYALGARMVVMLIGERPGLSSPDSLGAYITLNPMVGRSDAERNCVSNIRPGGLTYDRAALKMTWLIREGFKRGLTGVALKDESDLELISPNATQARLGAD